MRLTLEQFSSLVDQAIRAIPDEFQPYLADVVIDIEPMPDRRTCEGLGLRDPRTLMGLYHGTPLTERSIEQSGSLPDRVVLYQRNIERSGRTRREIVEEIRKTVLHEVGHHFGLEENDLDGLGYG
ncbi:MAG: metallopeptidase family protein [Planctomycetes bacterium]|nr:metallopeptidase family protein [Planctomycetota bacterium]